MMRTYRNILLASGLTAALAVAAGGSASAGSPGLAGTAVKEAAGASVLLVAETSRRAKRRTQHRSARAAGNPGPGYYPPPPGYYPPPPGGYPGLGYDNVGSIVYDGIGYGYNRRTGERYMTCQIDEGYGRVTPCDSGQGGGGIN